MLFKKEEIKDRARARYDELVRALETQDEDTVKAACLSSLFGCETELYYDYDVLVGDRFIHKFDDGTEREYRLAYIPGLDITQTFYDVEEPFENDPEDTWIRFVAIPNAFFFGGLAVGHKVPECVIKELIKY